VPSAVGAQRSAQDAQKSARHRRYAHAGPLKNSSKPWVRACAPPPTGPHQRTHRRHRNLIGDGVGALDAAIFRAAEARLLIAATAAARAEPKPSIPSFRTIDPSPKMNRVRPTKRAWGNDFAAWCAEHGLSALPADPAAVVAFIAAEAVRGVKCSTLGRRIAGIRYGHRLAGLAAVMRGARRTLGVAPVKKAAATSDRREPINGRNTPSVANSKLVHGCAERQPGGFACPTQYLVAHL
jgi:hypothetical protein